MIGEIVKVSGLLALAQGVYDASVGVVTGDEEKTAQGVCAAGMGALLILLGRIGDERK